MREMSNSDDVSGALCVDIMGMYKVGCVCSRRYERTTLNPDSEYISASLKKSRDHVRTGGLALPKPSNQASIFLILC